MSDPYDESSTFEEFRSRAPFGAAWWIHHGHDWTCRYWGISEAVDPETPFSKVPRSMFSASVPLFGEARLNGSPAAEHVVVSPFERLIVVRMDASVDQQLAAIAPSLRRSAAGFWSIEAAVSPSSFKPTHTILWPLKLQVWDSWCWSVQQGRDFQSMQKQVAETVRTAAATFSSKWGNLPVVDDALDSRERKKGTLSALLDSALGKNFVSNWLKQCTPLICDPRKDFAYRYLRAQLY